MDILDMLLYYLIIGKFIVLAIIIIQTLKSFHGGFHKLSLSNFVQSHLRLQV